MVFLALMVSVTSVYHGKVTTNTWDTVLPRVVSSVIPAPQCGAMNSVICSLSSSLLGVSLTLSGEWRGHK